MTYAAVVQMKKMLGNLDHWLGMATEHAAKKSFDPAVLLSARLAPDQFPLLKQIQSACDAAKAPAARLAGREPPKHPDTEQTLDEIRARIRTCTDYLATLTEKDFAGSEDRPIALPFLDGKKILGRDYLMEMALPNFFFHVTTAYAILRHNGIDLGKRNFIGGLTLVEA